MNSDAVREQGPRPGTRDPGPGTSRAFLADFGLAKSVATGSRLTRTGEALGTPAYMSPEQARGEVSTLGPPTDVWSIGCVLYEMLAGRPPWEAETTAAVVGALLTREPVPIRRRRSDVPRGLERIARASLSKSPRSRYADAGAVRDDLERVLRGETPRPPRRGRRGLVVLAAAALLVTGIAVGLGARRLARTESPASAPSRPAPPARADQLVARARGLRASDPAGAIPLYSEALAAEPTRDEWRVECGLLLWGVGRRAEALAEWERVGPVSREGPRARLYAGLLALFSLGEAGVDLRRAAEQLDAVEASGAPESRLGGGARAVLAGGWADARARLRDLPGWQAALLRAYVESRDPAGDRAAALREYGTALEEGIPLAWVRNNRGCLRDNLGDPRGALEDFEVAMRLQPGNPEHYYNRSQARQRLGDAVGAESDLDRALQLGPGSVDALTNRGHLREERGDLEGALSDYEAALRLGPEKPQALNGRGIVREARGDVEGALRDYEEAIRVAPGDAISYSNRGALRNDVLRDHTGAVEDFRRAVRLDPGLASAWKNLSVALQDLKDWAGASEALKEYLRRFPDHPDAAQAREWLAECEGRLRGAGR
ncbi:MAG: tetratricopeptide repeat-containing serine/threonine-protein kinase [Planctomycetales bacterium]|nr:tetratricopeptide repeat-containing serine/threonine-protein kinase [Planctomycetales bacterium]